MGAQTPVTPHRGDTKVSQNSFVLHLENVLLLKPLALTQAMESHCRSTVRVSVELIRKVKQIEAMHENSGMQLQF